MAQLDRTAIVLLDHQSLLDMKRRRCNPLTNAKLPESFWWLERSNAVDLVGAVKGLVGARGVLLL